MISTKTATEEEDTEAHRVIIKTDVEVAETSVEETMTVADDLTAEESTAAEMVDGVIIDGAAIVEITAAGSALEAVGAVRATVVQKGIVVVAAITAEAADKAVMVVLQGTTRATATTDKEVVPRLWEWVVDLEDLEVTAITSQEEAQEGSSPVVIDDHIEIQDENSVIRNNPN